MSKKVIVLRQYQEDIIEETLAAVEFGSDNIVIDSPPGSGKSIIIAKTAQHMALKVFIQADKHRILQYYHI